MAGIDFDTELFERKLQALKDSQESIQALSSWCLERRQHHKKIVATWLQVLKKVKVEHRLTLFYLANDVIQYSKRKNFEFVESWGTTLQRATTMVRDEKVKHRILRIFKIWDQRQVYDEEFLADLSGLISAAPKKKQEPQSMGPNEDFQAALLISTMRSCSTLEQATDARLRDLRDSSVDVETAEELCSSLKDRRHVEDAEKDVDIAVRNIENYVRALEAEIRERTQVLELLEQADQFYETQRGEVKIVTNAYRNFGSRVKNLKKKLDDLLPTLVSPIPSPDVNAPSPSPDSDIDLPGDENQVAIQSSIIEVAPPSLYGSYRQDYEPLPVPAPESSQANMTGDFTSNFSSFMGGTMDFDMRNLFSDRSTTPTGANQYNDSSEAKPIEVINMRPSKADNSNDGFNISSFLKAVLPSSEGTPNSTGIPGLGLDIPEPPSGTPPSPDYRNSSPIRQLPVTPANSKAVNSQSTPIGSAINCQMAHSTPLPSSVRSLLGDSHTPSPFSSQNSQGNASVVLAFENSVNSANPVNQMPPLPLPPPPPLPIFLDDENCYNKLPPKFPTWTSANEAHDEAPKWEEKGKNSMNPSWPGDGEEDTPKSKCHWESDSGNEHWETANEAVWPSSIISKNEVLSETPESPPIYEKAGFTDPVEYDDSQPQEPLLSSTGDVDHRVIPLPMTVEPVLPHRLVKAADVDHRNLISLTGSPANNSNPSEPPATTTANSNNLWPSTDQDYRQQVQPGDIVESVDMEMSDDETDTKQKGRVLVDVRSQDRDMRPLLPPPAHHLDLDMRMIPLPGGQMPASNPMLPEDDSHEFHQNPSDFHRDQSGFHQNQPEFHPNQPEFRPNQSEFHPNQPEFCTNQTEFRQNQPEFRSNQPEFRPNQPEFRPNHSDFRPTQPEFQQNQPEFRPNQPEFRPNHPEFRQNQPEFRPNQPEFRPNQPDFIPNQQEFRQNQPEFRPNKPDFRQNPPEFRPNQPDFRQNQPNFLQNQSNFPPNHQGFNQKQQEFNQNQPGFDFQENPHRRRASQEFQGDFQSRGGRFPLPPEQHLQNSPGFHRNERGRGRGFPRNRRDRFSDDLNQQHNVNQSNNRRSRNPGSSPDILPNNRPFLLKPPEAVVVLDDDGNIIELSDMAPQSPNNNESDIISNQSPFNPDRNRGPPGIIQNQRIQPRMLPDHRIPPGMLPHQRIPPPDAVINPHLPPTGDARVHQQPPGLTPEQHVAVPELIVEQQTTMDQHELIVEAEDQQLPAEVQVCPPESEHEIPLNISQDQPDSQVEPEVQLITTAVEHPHPDGPETDTDIIELNPETVSEEAEPPRQLSEQLEALMNSNKQTNNNLKRQSANGSLTERQGEGSLNKKRALLPNGPQRGPMGFGNAPLLPGAPVMGHNGPMVPAIGLPELHPAMVVEYDGPNSNPGFRPRGGGPFPPWRGGGPPRGRGGFRGGPRGPWIDRGGPRGPRDHFSPRGPKPLRGQFRGGGFRGRGRGNNW